MLTQNDYNAKGILTNATSLTTWKNIGVHHSVNNVPWAILNLIHLHTWLNCIQRNKYISQRQYFTTDCIANSCDRCLTRYFGHLIHRRLRRQTVWTSSHKRIFNYNCNIRIMRKESYMLQAVIGPQTADKFWSTQTNLYKWLNKALALNYRPSVVALQYGITDYLL